MVGMARVRRGFARCRDVRLDAQFYFFFLGVSAAFVGLLEMVGVELPERAEWLAFAVFAVVSMLAFRKRIYQLVRNRTGVVEERLNLGDRVTVPIRLEPGQTCRVDYCGFDLDCAQQRSASDRSRPRGNDRTDRRTSRFT